MENCRASIRKEIDDEGDENETVTVNFELVQNERQVFSCMFTKIDLENISKLLKKCESGKNCRIHFESMNGGLSVYNDNGILSFVLSHAGNGYYSMTFCVFLNNDIISALRQCESDLS